MEMFLKPISVSINNGSTVFLSNDLNAWDLMAMAFEGWVDGFSEREGGITLKDECSILQNTVGSHMVCTPSFSEVTWCIGSTLDIYRERERNKENRIPFQKSHGVGSTLDIERERGRNKQTNPFSEVTWCILMLFYFLQGRTGGFLFFFGKKIVCHLNQPIFCRCAS